MALLEKKSWSHCAACGNSCLLGSDQGARRASRCGSTLHPANLNRLAVERAVALSPLLCSPSFSLTPPWCLSASSVSKLTQEKPSYLHHLYQIYPEEGTAVCTIGVINQTVEMQLDLHEYAEWGVLTLHLRAAVGTCPKWSVHNVDA